MLVALFLVAFVALLACALARYLREATVLSQTRWAPDAALVEDEQWAGIEAEWHAFVDSLPLVGDPR